MNVKGLVVRYNDIFDGGGTEHGLRTDCHQAGHCDAQWMGAIINDMRTATRAQLSC